MENQEDSGYSGSEYDMYMEDDNDNTSNDSGEKLDGQERAYTINKFFSVEGTLLQKEMNYKGYVYKDFKWVEEGDPIGTTNLIKDIISQYVGVLKQHNTISALTDVQVNQILVEKFNAFTEACLRDTQFDWSRFALLKEDFDHTLQLFLSLVRNGRGAQVAMNLQSGMVNEIIHNKPEKPKNMLQETLDYVRGRDRK